MDKHDVGYTYSGILFGLKGSEILTQATTWINLEDIMRSDISQTQRDKYCMLPLM